jgi:hypothetical protein
MQGSTHNLEVPNRRHGHDRCVGAGDQFSRIDCVRHAELAPEIGSALRDDVDDPGEPDWFTGFPKGCDLLRVTPAHVTRAHDDDL